MVIVRAMFGIKTKRSSCTCNLNGRASLPALSKYLSSAGSCVRACVVHSIVPLPRSATKTHMCLWIFVSVM